MKSLFEQMGGTYREENGYLIPNLTLPDEEQVEIGVWGQRHLRYIKQHHKVRYTNLLTSGKLNGYLADIDKKAEDKYFVIAPRLKAEPLCMSLELMLQTSRGSGQRPENRRFFWSFSLRLYGQRKAAKALIYSNS